MQIATTYTAGSLPLRSMGNVLHRPTSPLLVLARNLKALLEARGRSARDVAKEAKVSNKTVSNMVNAAHSVQIGKAAAVANELSVPLWQLMCPALPAEKIGEKELHELIENYSVATPKDREHIAHSATQAALIAKTTRAA